MIGGEVAKPKVGKMDDVGSWRSHFYEAAWSSGYHFYESVLMVRGSGANLKETLKIYEE